MPKGIGYGGDSSGANKTHDSQSKNESKGRNSNKGQGKAGGSLSTPVNIPSNAGGTKFGRPTTINPRQESKESKNAGLGGNRPGSNKSSFVY